MMDLNPPPEKTSTTFEDASREVREAIRSLVAALDRLDSTLSATPPQPAWHDSWPVGTAEAATTTDTPLAETPSPWVASHWTDDAATEAVSDQGVMPQQDSHPEIQTEPGAWPYPPARDMGWPAAADGLTRPAADEQPASDEDAAREEVRRAVERMRAELGSSRAPLLAFAGVDETEDLSPFTMVPTEDGGESQPSIPETSAEWLGPDEDASVQPGPTVWNTSGAADEPEPEGEPSEPEAPQPEFDAREQVRQAVEETRASMQAGSEAEGAAPGSIAEKLEEEKLRVPHYEPLLDERFLQPAVLVIDDPEGRVELVRVYRTLARLEVAATANLANYSSHSVTVQMEERRLPERQDIADAIAYAFERECSVDIDGNRASVRLFGGKTRAA